MSLPAFIARSFRDPLKKQAASLLTKKLAHNNSELVSNSLGCSIEQTNINGKFAFLSIV